MRPLLAFLFLINSAVAQIVVAPAAEVKTPLVTVGDGITSFGQFNGTTQQPFRLALKALPGGGVIEVLPGHWKFDRAVGIPQDDITIRGSNGSKLISAATNSVGLFLIQGDHVRISGIQVKTTNSPVGGQAAIRGLGGSLTIDHCLFEATAGAPDYRFLEFGDGVSPRRGTLIESNTFLFSPGSDGVIGVTLRLGLDLRMVNNDFRRTVGSGLCRYAVEIQDESKGVIANNSFQNLGSGAKPLDAVVYSNADSEGHHFSITGNFFENCQTEQVLHLSGGRFCSVTGNVFGRMLAATGGAVRLGPSANGVVGESNVVSSNQFHNVALGVWVDDNLWNNISNNQFTICTTPQVIVGSNGQGVVMTGNQFVGSTSLTADIPTAITVTNSIHHLIHDNASMSQNQTFGFLTVVTSNSSGASILDNINM